jgi:hypothetical protein
MAFAYVWVMRACLQMVLFQIKRILTVFALGDYTLDVQAFFTLRGVFKLNQKVVQPPHTDLKHQYPFRFPDWWGIFFEPPPALRAADSAIAMICFRGRLRLALTEYNSLMFWLTLPVSGIGIILQSNPIIEPKQMQ